MVAWYLGSIQNGKTTKAEGSGTRIHNEFYVEQELNRINITTYLPKRVENMRTGKDRHPKPITRPYLPGYIFVDISPIERYFEIIRIKYLRHALQPITQADMDDVDRFRFVADEQFAQAERQAKSGEAISQYSEGQTLRVTGGLLAGDVLQYIKTVTRAHDPFPKVIASMEVMGRPTNIELDPLDVRAE